MEWYTGYDESHDLLAVLRYPDILELWDGFSGVRLWRKVFGEPVQSMAFNPFDISSVVCMYKTYEPKRREYLTHVFGQTGLGKQCRPRSGSTLFATQSVIFRHIDRFENGHCQSTEGEYSTSWHFENRDDTVQLLYVCAVWQEF